MESQGWQRPFDIYVIELWVVAAATALAVAMWWCVATYRETERCESVICDRDALAVLRPNSS